MMVDCGPEGRIFLSVPHTHDRFYFFFFFFFFFFFAYLSFLKVVFDNAVTSIADAQHIMMTTPWRLVTSLRIVTSTLTMRSYTIRV